MRLRDNGAAIAPCWIFGSVNTLEGWIKRHRADCESWLMQDHLANALYDWLYSMAQYKDGFEVYTSKGPMKLARGDVFFGTRHLAKELGTSQSAIRRALKRLEKATRIVTRNADRHGTVVTLEHYRVEQDVDVEVTQIPTQMLTQSRLKAGHQQEVKKERIETTTTETKETTTNKETKEKEETKEKRDGDFVPGKEKEETVVHKDIDAPRRLSAIQQLREAWGLVE